MEVIRGINKIKKIRNAVVALGVFDGVHRGHKKILLAAARKACSIKGKSVVLTFWPHPRKQESLYSLEHRIKLIAELGIDVCIVASFDRKFAVIAAEDFVRDILFKAINARYVYIGSNFRFGKGAKGNIKTLQSLSGKYNFKLNAFKMSRIRNKPISSTCIRALIKKGELANAARLLTRPVSILGTVIKGISLARRLGFPTANIDPHHEVIPPSGVYAVKVILDDKKLSGVCNIGTKPTFRIKGEKPQKHVELHIFDFNRNIYGKYLEIQFEKKIREESKFKTPLELIKQIKKDIKIVLGTFSLHR